VGSSATQLNSKRFVSQEGSDNEMSHTIPMFVIVRWNNLPCIA